MGLDRNTGLWGFTTLRASAVFADAVDSFDPVAIPPRRARDVGSYIGLVCCYGLAKVLEYFDPQVFELIGVVSGHSLKHLAAGTGDGVSVCFVEKQHTDVKRL